MDQQGRSEISDEPNNPRGHTVKQMSTDMQACIDECLRCYQICLGSAMTHALETGGKHTDPKHFRLMMACAGLCRAAAHFMLLNSPHLRMSARSAPSAHATARIWMTWTIASRHPSVALRVAVRWRADQCRRRSQLDYPKSSKPSPFAALDGSCCSQRYLLFRLASPPGRPGVSLRTAQNRRRYSTYPDPARLADNLPRRQRAFGLSRSGALDRLKHDALSAMQDLPRLTT